MSPRTAALVLALSAAVPAGAQPAAGGTRVEEEANRPMRMILEAAKIKSRAKPAEAPAPKAAAVLPAARVAPEPAAAARTEPPPAPPPVGMVQSTVVTVEVEAAPPARMPDVVPPAAPDPEPMLAAAPKDASPALTLVSLVEPVTPRHLLGRLRGEIRVDVAFTVTPDGTVSDAAVRSSSHPQMNAAVLEAVSQWRYQPIGSAREHSVQVVLRPDS